MREAAARVLFVLGCLASCAVIRFVRHKHEVEFRNDTAAAIVAEVRLSDGSDSWTLEQ